MRVGLYGGCFNPVHEGHVAAARNAQEALLLDQVVFIPSGQPPLKGSTGLADGKHRVAMLNFAIQSEKAMRVSMIEIGRIGPSFTVDTVRCLQATFPEETELFFLLGDDCVDRLQHWKGIAELHSMLRFAILPRNKIHAATPDERLIWLEFASVATSSSSVRAILSSGDQPSEGIMHASVLDYITRHKLYAGPIVHACL